jgi:hypothetical protein
MGVQHGGRRRAPGAVIGQPLDSVGAVTVVSPKRAQSVLSVGVRTSAPVSGRGDASQAGTSRS